MAKLTTAPRLVIHERFAHDAAHHRTWCQSMFNKFRLSVQVRRETNRNSRDLHKGVSAILFSTVIHYDVFHQWASRFQAILCRLSRTHHSAAPLQSCRDAQDGRHHQDASCTSPAGVQYRPLSTHHLSQAHGRPSTRTRSIGTIRRLN